MITNENEISADTRRVQVSRGLLACFVALGALLGLGAAFLVGPANRWIDERFDLSFLPLRVLAGLPAPWHLAILGAIGLAAGAAFAWGAARGTLTLDVRPDGVLVRREGPATFVARGDIHTVFTDSEDLVLTSGDGRELLRTDLDISTQQVTAAFTSAGYPWIGTNDPDEHRFRDWIDGDPDLDPAQLDLLRTRARAARDKQDDTTADLREKAHQFDLIIRDRRSGQQWRKPTPS